MTIFVLEPLGFRKLSHSSEMRNDALVHREGLEGQTKIIQRLNTQRVQYIYSSGLFTYFSPGKGMVFAILNKTIIHVYIVYRYSNGHQHHHCL